ncbi:hypothetical protein P355_3479 [Burkholderia cenocepacia KC-01]|nr:hypothetical protein P355_3479 [Burkholderia cenocepacia KC-01]
MRRAVPLRDRVVAVHQHAVERVRRVEQFLARLRGAERMQQRVDGRRFQSDEVVGARLVGELARVARVLLGARHLHARQADRRHVVVECIEALLQQRVIGRAKPHDDAELRQVALVGGHDAFHRAARIVEDLERERLALRVAQRAVAIGPAGLREQCARLQQVRAQRARRIRVRLRDRRAEHGRIELPAQWLQQLQLAVARRTGRLQVGVGEITVEARVCAVEQLPVQPLEVEREVERLAHAHVAEQRPAQVHEEALHAGAVMLAEFALDELAAVETLADVAPRPVARDVLDEHVVFAGLERLEPRDAVAVQLVHDPLEVVGADPYRQVGAPVRGVAPVGDRAAVVVALDHVRAAADRLLERKLVERDARAVRAQSPLARKHGHAAGDQRQFAVRATELEAHGRRIDDHGLRDFREIRAELRRGLLALQRVERKLDVVGRDAIAVREAGARIQVERDRTAVRGDVDVVGQQPVGGRRFVGTAGREALEQHVDAGRGVAAHRERIELVERRQSARIREHERAALRRVGVHVVEMLEARRILRLAVLRDGVGRVRGRRGQHRMQRQHRGHAAGGPQRAKAGTRGGGPGRTLRHRGPVDRMRVVTWSDSTHSVRRAKRKPPRGRFSRERLSRTRHTCATGRSAPAVVAAVIPVTAIAAPAAAMVAIPLVAAPVAAAVPVAVAVPADHDRRRRGVHGRRCIDRRRLVDDRRRRRRIHGRGRDVDRCRHADVDPDIDSRHCCARHEQGRHTGQERGNTQSLHGFLFWLCHV